VKDPLKGVDLRHIAIAPRPPGALDGIPKKGETGMSRDEKLKKAQDKVTQKKDGYTKQYRVVEKDSEGNELVRTDTTKEKKKKKHHSKSKHGKKISP
jgi:hypothetical protein